MIGQASDDAVGVVPPLFSSSYSIYLFLSYVNLNFSSYRDSPVWPFWPFSVHFSVINATEAFGALSKFDFIYSVDLYSVPCCHLSFA